MPSFAFATVTWIRNKEEEKVVVQTLSELSKLSFPIVVVDKSEEGVGNLLKQISNVIYLREESSLTKQIITAQIEAAKHAEYIFYTQSDKYDFAKNIAPLMLETYKKLGSHGILIPSRIKESMDTYPAFQKDEETFLNYFLSEYIGVEEDYFAGPKIYPASLVGYLQTITGEVGWGVEAFLYVLAKRQGIPFDFLPCFIQSPKEVIEDKREVNNYRLKITQWIIEGFLQGQRIKLDEK